MCCLCSSGKNGKSHVSSHRAVGRAFVLWPDLRVVVFSLQVLKPSRTGEVLPIFLSNYVALL
jgi:hypothetical protein